MKRLEDMSLEELWQLFPIILVEHNDAWKDWAEDEMRYLSLLLDGLHTEVHHVGSTAISSIMAKPIIDILVAVDKVSLFGIVKQRLLDAGYICMSETDRRQSFNKGYTPQGYAERVFHIHVRVKGDTDEIFFRDYLNLHPDVAKEYEQLKLKLCEKYKFDRDAYTDAKTEFINRYTTLAKA